MERKKLPTVRLGNFSAPFLRAVIFYFFFHLFLSNTSSFFKFCEREFIRKCSLILLIQRPLIGPSARSKIFKKKMKFGCPQKWSGKVTRPYSWELFPLHFWGHLIFVFFKLWFAWNTISILWKKCPRKAKNHGILLGLRTGNILDEKTEF